MVALSEVVVEYDGPFVAKEIAQIRVLFLEEGRYLQRLYRKNLKQEWEQFEDDIVPLLNGTPLTFIPFFFFGPKVSSERIQKPPIADLVALNLSHYRTTADLEHGAHYTGLPTAVVTGHTVDEGDSLSIGSSAAWVFSDPAAKAYYLEFTGQGLSALENRLKAKEDGMAAIGARMLAPEKKSAEASKTVEIRHSGEGAVLASLSDQIEHGMDRVLQFMAEWASINGEVKTEFNDDFVDTLLDYSDLLALVKTWQAGGMSDEMFFWNLKQGEFYEEDWTFEQEQSAKRSGPETLVKDKPPPQ